MGVNAFKIKCETIKLKAAIERVSLATGRSSASIVHKAVEFFGESAIKLTPMTKMKKRAVLKAEDQERVGGRERWKVPYRFSGRRRAKLGWRGVRFYHTKSNAEPFREITYRGLGKLGWSAASPSAKLPSLTAKAMGLKSVVSSAEKIGDWTRNPGIRVVNKSLTVKNYVKAQMAMSMALGKTANRLNSWAASEERKLQAAWRAV